jgi:hypothetical protein
VEGKSVQECGGMKRKICLGSFWKEKFQWLDTVLRPASRAAAAGKPCRPELLLRPASRAAQTSFCGRRAVPPSSRCCSSFGCPLLAGRGSCQRCPRLVARYSPAAGLANLANALAPFPFRARYSPAAGLARTNSNAQQTNAPNASCMLQISW